MRVQIHGTIFFNVIIKWTKNWADSYIFLFETQSIFCIKLNSVSKSVYLVQFEDAEKSVTKLIFIIFLAKAFLKSKLVKLSIENGLFWWIN